MAVKMTGAEMVIKALADQGVEHIFGYPGGAVLPIYDELFQQEKVKHILDFRRAALEALTRRLIEVESVDADVLKRIMDEHSPGPHVVPGTAALPTRSSPPPDQAETIAPAAIERSV